MSARSTRLSNPQKGLARTKATKGRRRKANSSGLDRPFAPEIIKTAGNVVSEYQIVVESDESHWYGRGLELPHVFGDGKTPQECIKATREALAAAVAYMLEQGQTLPTSAKQGKRTTQVNVRLTAEEKTILEGTARRKGFEGLSDFMRAAA